MTWAEPMARRPADPGAADGGGPGAGLDQEAGHNEAAIGRPGPIALEVPIASCRSPDRWLFLVLFDVRSARAYRQGQVVRLRQGVWLSRP